MASDSVPRVTNLSHRISHRLAIHTTEDSKAGGETDQVTTQGEPKPSKSDSTSRDLLALWLITVLVTDPKIPTGHPEDSPTSNPHLTGVVFCG